MTVYTALPYTLYSISHTKQANSFKWTCQWTALWFFASTWRNRHEMRKSWRVHDHTIRNIASAYITCTGCSKSSAGHP